MKLNTLQCSLGFLVGASAFVGGVLPPLLSKCSIGHNSSILSVINIFNAGVFLGGSLIHLLPDAVEGMHHLQLDWLPLHREFPTAFLLCAIGFISVVVM